MSISAPALERRQSEAGLTILELMVVLVILSMIAGLVYQAVIPKVDEAKVKTAKTQMEILGLALDSFRLDVGSYPGALQELVESSATGWKGPYLRGKSVPLDPWGNQYQYEVVDGGAAFRLSSSGGGKEPIVSGE